MIIIRFTGHENILGTHFNTFEFTADPFVTKKGDCIIGVNSKFDFSGLKDFLGESEVVKVKGKIIVSLNGQKYADEFEGILNKNFDIYSREIVFRKSQFDSYRTLAIRCNKPARDLDRNMIEALKNPKAKGECVIALEI